jgi:aspartyl protease family protein
VSEQGELPSTFKVVTVWLIIALALYLAFAWYQQEQTRPKIVVATNQKNTVMLESRGRHFVALVKFQGRDQELLVDTGASMTTISRGLAEKLQLKKVSSQVFQTANGSTTADIVLASLEIPGLLTIDSLPVAVMKDMEGPGLLGMDVLRRVRMVQEGGKLILSATGGG